MDALRIGRADIVGHDIGNMVAFAFAAAHQDRTTRLVMMDAPVPGIGPWEEILKNPLLWHFRFGGPDMERLVAGRERIYLDRFWNEFAADPAQFPEAARRHYAALYAEPGRMHAGFLQFAAFDQDAIDNRASMAPGTAADAGARHRRRSFIRPHHGLRDALRRGRCAAGGDRQCRPLADGRAAQGDGCSHPQLPRRGRSADAAAADCSGSRRAPAQRRGSRDIRAGWRADHHPLRRSRRTRPVRDRDPRARPTRALPRTAIATTAPRWWSPANGISAMASRPATPPRACSAPGGFYTEPANQPHFAFTGKLPAVVYITGQGPTDTTYLVPDALPRK